IHYRTEVSLTQYQSSRQLLEVILQDCNNSFGGNTIMNDKTIKVPLKLIVDAVEMASNEWNQYLDIETMNIVSIPQFDDGLYEEYAELTEQIEGAYNKRYFELPDKYDIHEYRIMERFIYSLPSGSVQDDLERAIRGNSAFRRFKASIRYYRIEQDWYDYLAEAYRKIAVEWCESNGFKYYEERKEQNL
ncbi:MAG: UPF0158 family protein, partial [Ruminococcus sp.]|nr:UPF0158 family protein [Ruminococcus sp.]